MVLSLNTFGVYDCTMPFNRYTNRQSLHTSVRCAREANI